MGLLYITDKAKEKETIYGPIITNQLSILQNSENIKDLVEQYRYTNLYKRRTNKFRIILELVKIELEDKVYEVFCVRDILPRSSNEYDPFEKSNNLDEWIKKNSLTENDKNLIKEWLIKELEEEERRKELPELPDELCYLTNIKGAIKNNFSVYEMQEWTENILQKDIFDFKETICNGILSILDGSIQNDKIENVCETNANIKLCKLENDIWLLYEQIFTDDKNLKLILYNVYKKNKPTQKDIQNLLANYINNENEDFNESFIRDAKRAYPDYILLEPELWFKIQEDKIANLALSPEEEEILLNAEFPLFINGQAGSGKSTMLYYLFAYYCSLDQTKYKPLFLTYNEKLLQIAKKSVESILKNHPLYSEKERNKKECNKLNFEEIFYPFQELIFKKILNDEEKLKFARDKYLSFNKFKLCYNGNYPIQKFNCAIPNKNKLSPELAWHIIRTFIKGYNCEGELKPEDYNNLPKKEKTVSYESYKWTYDNIWKNWYEKLSSEQSLWDDQDLVRYVLKNKKELPSFSVIFCDEAQDFTRIEIEFLLKLSAFSKYNLSGCDNIPYSFAGDPYQTINPTGFRWESVKTIFNDKFEKINHKKIKIKFAQLNKNYRAKPAITKFANLIQYFRFKYLHVKELKPQLPWQKVEGVSPCIFIFGQNLEAEHLQSVADKTIILIPTDEGENFEVEFAKKDKELSKFIQIPENAEAPISNVMSSSAAKGLEFDRVIVYKFGEAAPESFQKAINNEELSDSEEIELSYFFNKLYVSLSRARDFLFIIDSQLGYEKFWKFFTNEINLNIEDDEEIWKAEYISPFVIGLKNDIDNIQENDPEKVAKELEYNGRNQENYSLLYRASQYYKLQKKDLDSKRCLAWAYWYKENWTEAGKFFEELKDYEQAFKAYWKAKNWNKIIELYNKEVGINKNYFILSKFMLKQESLESIISIKDFIIDKFEISDGGWHEIMLEIEKQFKDLNNLAENLRYKYAYFARALANLGYKNLYSYAADLFYREKNYEMAIDCWDRIGHIEHADYYKSKLQIIDDINVNEQIIYLYKLKEEDKILDLSKKSHNLNQESHNIIFAILLKKDFDSALNYENVNLKTRIKKLLETSAQESDEESAKSKKVKIFDYLLSEDNAKIEVIKENLFYFKEFFGDKETLRKIFRLNNWGDLIRQFEKEFRLAFPGKYIEIAVDIICDEIKNSRYALINYAIYLISKIYDETLNISFSCKLIKTLAYENITPINFNINQTQKISNFVINFIAQKSGWKEYLNFKEIATLFERIGCDFNFLKEHIYEYIINYESQYSDWAKLRYIKSAQRELRRLKFIHRKQALGLEQSSSSKQISTIEEQIATLQNLIDEKISEWGTDMQSLELEPEYPNLGEKLENFLIFEDIKIYNLLNRQPQYDENKKRITININSFELKLNVNNKLFLIEDTISNKTANIELISQSVMGPDVRSMDNVFWFGNNCYGEFIGNNMLKLIVEDEIFFVEIIK